MNFKELVALVPMFVSTWGTKSISVHYDLPEEHFGAKFLSLMEPLNGEGYKTVDRTVENSGLVVEASRHFLHCQHWAFRFSRIDRSRCCSLECKSLVICAYYLSMTVTSS